MNIEATLKHDVITTAGILPKGKVVLGDQALEMLTNGAAEITPIKRRAQSLVTLEKRPL